MAELILGISVGAFMSAFVNSRYNKLQWVKSKYLVWLGVILLGVSLALF